VEADIRPLGGNSRFDPLRKSGGPKCCDAQHGFFDDVVGYVPRTEGMPMRRREFITLLGGATAWPVAARAQVSAKRPLVGWLFSGSQNNIFESLQRAFLQRLNELGYVEGRHFDTIYRFANGDGSRMPVLAGELVRLKPNVIFTGSVPATFAVKQATTTIPIVCASLQDPVSLGLVASYASPGGNITGIASNLPGLPGKRLEIIRELIPSATKIGLLVNINNQGHAAQQRETEAAATMLAVKIIPAEVRMPADIDTAFRVLSQERVDMVIVLLDFMFFNEGRRIGALAAAARLPTMYAWRENVEAGGLISYGVNDSDNYRLAASYVVKILKGAEPRDLPVKFPNKLEMVINLNTARALGLTVPPTLIFRADEVIE